MAEEEAGKEVEALEKNVCVVVTLVLVCVAANARAFAPLYVLTK